MKAALLVMGMLLLGVMGRRPGEGAGHWWPRG